MKLSNIAKFENANNISVNVFSWDESVPLNTIDDVYKHPYVNIILKSTKLNAPIYNLLLLTDASANYHYVAIHNLERLLNCNTLGLTRIQCTWCHKCLLGFRSTTTYNLHKNLCNKNIEGTTMYVMPKEKVLKFKDFSKTITYPFTIYADFESVLIPGAEGEFCQTHKPASAGFLLVSHDGTNSYHEFVGDDCVFQFLTKIDSLTSNELSTYYKANCFKPMIQLTFATVLGIF